MSLQRGRDMLLKVESTGDVTFVTVLGLRARSLRLNSQIIDGTHADSAGRWRELIPQAGVRQAEIQGSGVFRDETADRLVRDIFFSESLRNWKIITPGMGVFHAPFLISQLEYSGEHDGEMTFEITLQSAGEVQFSSNLTRE